MLRILRFCFFGRSYGHSLVIVLKSLSLGVLWEFCELTGLGLLVCQGFSLGSAIGHSPKIVSDVRDFAVQFGQFVRDNFRKRCTVMHSDAIVFFALKTITDWPNLC